MTLIGMWNIEYNLYCFVYNFMLLMFSVRYNIGCKISFRQFFFQTELFKIYYKPLISDSIRLFSSFVGNISYLIELDRSMLPTKWRGLRICWGIDSTCCFWYCMNINVCLLSCVTMQKLSKEKHLPEII